MPSYLWARMRDMVREARHDPTPAEKLLWQHIRRKSLGVQFRRQHPILIFYVDFYCSATDLVVELDGPIHDRQTERDAIRTEILETLGFRVIRFTNDEVFADPTAVVEQIRNAVNSHSPRVA